MISYNEFKNSYKLDGHMIVEFDNSLFFVHQGDIFATVFKLGKLTFETEIKFWFWYRTADV